ncbi:PEP/pyruvate-binding domain-containing protein [Lachnotalea glycerini]|nr:PEP/pyruvate-binding domain-containing protein [Lachnotalea glycerini]
MKQFIIGFEKICKDDVNIAGGKGANLGEMTKAGIPVPEGVVLTAQAYECYMKDNGIDQASMNADAIRKAILEGEIPSAICEEVTMFYHSLGAGAQVAVRSSATAEDLEDASFAGQQETYLNVSNDKELLDKIKQCYSSLWGDRAVTYRHRQGYDHQKVSLAVVIQRMVKSDCAGVIFTANTSGNANEILINASYGLGEAVVSGLVTPDEYLCGRSGEVLRVTIGSKKEQIVYGMQGTKTVTVPENLRSIQVLTEGEIQTLVKKSMEIEVHYGHPMDIEWAFAEGSLYILQARSITTTSTQHEELGDEDFKGLPPVKIAKGKMRETLLFNLEKTPMAYYPLDHDFAGMVGKQKSVLMEEAGIDMSSGEYPVNEDGIIFMPSYTIKLTKNIIHILSFIKQLKNHNENSRLGEDALTECRKEFQKIQKLPVGNTQEAGYVLEQMKEMIGKTAYYRFRYALFPSAFAGIFLNRQLKKVDSKFTSFDLLGGLSYVTTDLSRELYQMAAMISKDGAIQELVLKHDYATVIAHNTQLKDMFDVFLKKYGSKSDYNCYCFIAKSWVEDPDRFLMVLRPILRNGQKAELSAEEGMKKYKDLLNRLKKISGDKNFQKAESLIKAFRSYHVIRESSQYLWETEFLYCRKILTTCAKLLQCEMTELYYLFADELFEICKRGTLTEDDRKTIRRRKEKRPLAEGYWNKQMMDALGNKNGQITGISGSTGQARGPVCIVNGPEEFDKLQPGDILVCAHTDPEWTSLFGIAAGIIVDTGGSLSHAAIVAREYGIPAVLAVGTATKQLKDGERVLVDGTKGQVFHI